MNKAKHKEPKSLAQAISFAILALALPMALAFGIVGGVMNYKGISTMLPKAVSVTVQSTAQSVGNKLEVYETIAKVAAADSGLYSE